MNNKEPYTLADLVRKVVLNTNCSDDINRSLIKEINAVCHDYLSKKSQKERIKGFDYYLEDITSDVYVKFVENLHLPFWQETLEPGAENDSRIIGYFYVLVQDCHESNSEKIFNQNSVNLYTAISEICNELDDTGKIYSDNGYYKLSKGKCISYFESTDVLNGLYVDLRIRGVKKELNHKRLRDFIIEIIEILENTCISVSDLTRVVSQNSNYGNFVTQEHRAEVTYVPNDPYIEKSRDIVDIQPKIFVHSNQTIAKWINDFIRLFRTEEKRISAALIILLYFEYDYTLEKISSVLEESGFKAKKSTVKNRINMTTDEIGFRDNEYEEEELRLLLHLFLSELEKQFIPKDLLMNVLMIQE
jgi:hypothetical protein